MNKELKSSEEFDLKEFIDQNYRFITVMGIFGALTAYFSNISATNLSFLCFVIFIVLTWKFSDILSTTLRIQSKTSLELKAFYWLIFMFCIYIFAYAIETYKKSFLDLLDLFLLGILFIGLIYFAEKGYFNKIIGFFPEKRSKLVTAIILLIIFIIFIFVVDYLANMIRSFIS